MPAPRVVVVGSINMDLIVGTPRIPDPGETVLGDRFATGPGGKGANQAVAAARAGAEVAFVGAVGTDTFALELRQSLVDAEVDVTQLREIDGPSGVAMITVDDAGRNSIVVAPGANGSLAGLTAADLDAIASADVLLCQLEIPLDTAVSATAHARAHGTVVLLNPSPVRPLPPDLTDSVDVLVANEAEAAQLADDIAAVPHRITTLGGRGARHLGPDGGRTAVAPPQVDVVDTTGAGDAFAGALAAVWGRRDDALAFAVAAGALATTRRGAAASAPQLQEIESILPD
ncbi:ribokinase [Rhodococcus triatomae]|uniref:ribokinase n=1 Tax=Rhodococcus triatomae TaxID=300028 RepID=UPI00157CE4E5|nr:ribokinase [Rhodococcus triatomae]